MLIAKIVVLLSIYLTQQKKNKKAKKAKKIDEEEFEAKYGKDFWAMVRYNGKHYKPHKNSKNKISYYVDVPINKTAKSYTNINFNNPPLYSDFS